MTSQEPIKVLYTNWRGETSMRSVTPMGIHFGSTEWHPEPQWLLKVFDHDKQAERDYALRDCVFAQAPDVIDPDELLTLKHQFVQEMMVKSALEATQEDLAAEPGVIFPSGWFLIQHRNKPLAMFPSHKAAHDHVGWSARGLAEAALRKVTSAKT